jgi:predicted DNA-binding protein
MKYKGGLIMPLSLRIQPEKEKKLRKAAARLKKTKTSYVLEAIDEKLGLQKPKAQMIREIAGWLSHEETEEIRKAVSVFATVREGDWD